MENRKSNNPMVLGFQGKAQLETLYGHMAEVMLSLRRGLNRFARRSNGTALRAHTRAF
jgi:hypothetical protein